MQAFLTHLSTHYPAYRQNNELYITCRNIASLKDVPSVEKHLPPFSGLTRGTILIFHVEVYMHLSHLNVHTRKYTACLWSLMWERILPIKLTTLIMQLLILKLKNNMYLKLIYIIKHSKSLPLPQHFSISFVVSAFQFHCKPFWEGNYL